jgi:hypothetical protein
MVVMVAMVADVVQKKKTPTINALVAAASGDTPGRYL